MKPLKIFASFLLLLLAYAGATAFLPPPAVYKYQQQWDENAAKAQRYLLSVAPLPEALVVGSSLSERMPGYAFDSCFYNLALAGGSSLTGLELASRRDKLPGVILIESNILSRKADMKFVEEADSRLARLVPVFRQDRKPVNYLYSTLYSLQYSPQAEYRKQMQKSSDPRVREIALGPLLADNDSTRPEAEIRQSAELYRPYISRFVQGGSRAAFFEMPIDPRLRNGKRATQIRDTLRSEFKDVPYIDLGAAAEFQSVDTTDGLHLTAADAVKAGRLLSREAGLTACGPQG
ncbi:MAG TPA: hypothetical protein VFA75_10715 [Nevskia sp.]|nr:hypothetical protein [Nevskia sp.]